LGQQFRNILKFTNCPIRTLYFQHLIWEKQLHKLIFKKFVYILNVINSNTVVLTLKACAVLFVEGGATMVCVWCHQWNKPLPGVLWGRRQCLHRSPNQHHLPGHVSRCPASKQTFPSW